MLDQNFQDAKIQNSLGFLHSERRQVVVFPNLRKTNQCFRVGQFLNCQRFQLEQIVRNFSMQLTTV